MLDVDATNCQQTIACKESFLVRALPKKEKVPDRIGKTYRISMCVASRFSSTNTSNNSLQVSRMLVRMDGVMIERYYRMLNRGIVALKASTTSFIFHVV
jgi:hypothetical protein